MAFVHEVNSASSIFMLFMHKAVGGIAFGFDRLCSLFGGADTIRDFIAFPKNNAGRDVMIEAPSAISEEQLKELSLSLKKTV